MSAPASPSPRPPSSTPDAARFRRTLVRVMTMQIATLLALGVLQVVFSH